MKPILIALTSVAMGLVMTPSQLSAQSDAADSPGAAGPLFETAESDEPIDIIADRLDVHRDDRVAVFTGAVDAVQGVRRLESSILTVQFAEREGEPEDSEDPTGNWGAVQTMRATGGVRLTTPDEVATGDWALYDADGRTVVLHENVVVTRGENVIRGSKLTINLDTGLSSMESGENRRVRGIFFTNEEEETDGPPSDAS